MNKPILMVALAASLLIGCGTQNLEKVPQKLTPLTTKYSEETLKKWPHEGFKQGFPGLDLAEAYKLLQNLKPTNVIVGIVDSGVDINHEDLKAVIWTNPNEIPNNGIDDDKNGYVDDVHGWNFLGNIAQANTEMTRIVRAKDTKSPMYKKAKEAYEKEVKTAEKSIEGYEKLIEMVNVSDQQLRKIIGKEVYNAEDLEAATKGKNFDEFTTQIISFMKEILADVEDSKELKEELPKAIEHFNTQLKYHLNTEFDPRKQILKDDENDWNNKHYGDGNVIGPDPEEALHGTHVAGIVAAVRDNGIGMNGVANAAIIMPVRAVPDGDEYDKDIALAIRYAVDNGAKVINTSFGKAYSPHKEWVYEAIKYAASKDVLIVNAADNDSEDIDVKETFPNDEVDGKEIADNFLTVGALNYQYNEKLVASFSNYGKRNVDVFAPGVKIYATTPGNKYEFLQGTSMASPEVAGLAALLRSYFPTLTAAQVKEVIMKSGIRVPLKVYVGDRDETGKQPMKKFSELSTTGTIVNAKNAVLLAAKKANVKLK